jgi:pheromone shutdown protein TraB
LFSLALRQAMLELSKEFPALHRPLIGERDQYMVSVLRTLAAECVARLARC